MKTRTTSRDDKHPDLFSFVNAARYPGMNPKKLLLIALRLCLSSDYRLVRSLKVFDSSYYLKMAGEDPEKWLDPLWSYLKITGDDYLEDGLVEQGWKQLADPNPLFDTAFYLLRYFPGGLAQNPFVHYLRQGWRKGYWPGPYFTPEIYKKRSSWAGEANPLSHYTTSEGYLRNSPGSSFDVQWYFDNYPEFIELQSWILSFHRQYGARENKSPVPVFDPVCYLNQLNDKHHASVDPFAHYMSCVGRDGPSPGSWFDADFYASQCSPEMQPWQALVHYLNGDGGENCYRDRRVARLPRKPRISVIVPVYNPDPRDLNYCIRSVLYQVYPHWELCLADDCSDDPQIAQLLNSWAEKDSRIKLTFLHQNSGISAATNAAAELATGEYLGFLDNDDELTIDCLYRVVQEICESGAELLYSDEDLIRGDGIRLSTFRKPDYNEELLLSHNYITHFMVTRRSLFHGVGGLDSRVDGAQDYDLALKLSEKTERISHIPRILYHWRASETSTSINHGQKNYAHEAGKTGLAAAVQRRQIQARVEDSGLNFFYRLEPAIKEAASVAVILWLAELNEGYRQSLLHLIARTSYGAVRFILVSPRSGAKEWLDEILLTAGEPAEHARLIPVSPDTPRAEGLDLAIREVDCDYLAFIELPFQDLSGDWLNQLRASFRSEAGLVCGRISYNGLDGRSYSLPQLADLSAHYYCRFLQSHTMHANGLHCAQEIPCGGWQIAMLGRDLYLELGGFDYQNFPELFAMADLSLGLRAEKKTIHYTPGAVIDLETDTTPVTDDDFSGSEEKVRFQQKWTKSLNNFDTYYNPGLLRDNGIDCQHYLLWLAGEKNC